jgi:hypothetical protein
MFIKLLIISVVIVGFLMLALATKVLFGHDSEVNLHSHELKGKGTSTKACAACEIKDYANCTEEVHAT